MGAIEDFTKEKEKLKEHPEFNDDSVWIVVDSSVCEPGVHYVFLEDRKDLAIIMAQKCGWDNLRDSAVSDHLNRANAINQGQTKISICRVKVTGWDPKEILDKKSLKRRLKNNYLYDGRLTL